MNWYIGQDVVCVKEPPIGYEAPIKKGAVYPVKGLRDCPCKCNDGLLIDIGNKVPCHLRRDIMQCGDCNGLFNTDGTAWYHEKCFAPLDTLADISELTEVLTTTKPFEV